MGVGGQKLVRQRGRLMELKEEEKGKRKKKKTENHMSRKKAVK